MENVILVSGSELKEIVRQAVHEEISNFKPPDPKPVSSDDLISINEVCAILKLSKTTVFAMRKRGELNYYRIKGSRLVRYSRNEVLSATREIRIN